mgnify:CR=1 FL=1
METKYWSIFDVQCYNCTRWWRKIIHLVCCQVKLWITINEPASIVSGYASILKKSYAPALYLDSPANYIVTYNLLRAHARVYKLYDTKFRPVQNGTKMDENFIGLSITYFLFKSNALFCILGKISITIDSSCYIEKTSSKEDIEAKERAWAFCVSSSSLFRNRDNIIYLRYFKLSDWNIY